MRTIRTLLIMMALFSSALGVVAAAPVSLASSTALLSSPAPVTTTPTDESYVSQPEQPKDATPVTDLLNPDGTLRLDGTFSGAVDTRGWDVTLDPDDGVRFSPQNFSGEWHNLEVFPLGVLGDTVTAVAISGTDIIAGGYFTSITGVPGARYIARWDGRAWHPFGGVNAINGPVLAIAIAGTDVYIGGDFTNVGTDQTNPNANRIARWDGRQWHALGSGLNATVRTIVVNGADVYVGGDFTNAGGVRGANYIAHWDGSQWRTVGSPNAIEGFFSSTRVNAIAVSGTDVYVGGEFRSAGGVSGTACFTRWDGNRWHRTAILAQPWWYCRVEALTISGSDVYVSGNFTDAGGVPGASYIARWDGRQWYAIGGRNAILVPSGIGGVSAIAVSGTDVYVGGDFTNAGGVPGTKCFARWDGTRWHGARLFHNHYDSPCRVRTIAVSGSDIYVGGDFPDAGRNTAADYLARWDGTTWHELGSVPGRAINSPVNTIVVHGSDVYVGGRFTNAGGVLGADYLARWDGNRWHAVGGLSALNGAVNAIVIDGTNIYVGGGFTDAGRMSGVNYIARWDGNQWHNVGGLRSLNGRVNAIAIDGANIYVGGNFTNANGVRDTACLARWDGHNWHSLGSGINCQYVGYVSTIAISGADVYVGGDFRNAGGVRDANYIARWDGNRWHALGSGLNGEVYTIAVNGADIYVGGRFTNAGGVRGANSIARWDGSQWHAVGEPNAFQAFSWIATIAFKGANVYVGGAFSRAGNNNAAANIAVWNGATWMALPGSNGAGLNGSVNTIALTGDEVYAGGGFTSAGGNTLAQNIARYSGQAPPSPPPSSPAPPSPPSPPPGSPGSFNVHLPLVIR